MSSTTSKKNPWGPHLWPPFTQIISASPPIRVLGGDGAILHLENSESLIDAISSWWVTLHGHAHPEIASAIYEQAKQLEQVIFANFVHPQAEKLATRLSALTGLERLFFSDNGSTAVEVALKIAYQFWANQGEPRQQIIAFEGAYHGDTFGAMAVGERNLFNEAFEGLLFPVSRLPWPHTWWDDQNVENKEQLVLQQLEKLLKTPTAAVILEPLIQGAGGMKIVRKEFLQSLENLVRKSGALLIADEVLTGFGRCGQVFAFQRAGITPDLISLSKGLTAGFLPMGVTMAKESIFETFIGEDPRVTLWHGHSFTANPLGCAAANASLDLLAKEPHLFEKFEERHRPHLEELSTHSKVSKPRLIGSIAAFDLAVNDQKGYLNHTGKVLQAKALEHGVFLRPLGQVVYLLPPLCLTDDQLEKCYFAIKKGLDCF
ncbi:adenosylmethionine--8-amino-7-oxononanoate transaminase [Prochlorococcus sp. MIT 1300]|uniref:adenosylmethionine--8-amino-7-oxononanoate transaminase n=1 Tax=Prochlorococcus sp. MIT 1300 TaxID=3096218 RepID=UPI002A754816|nr:adenosylmethionine--8-amino-7-oxononanoate transaminase [Prochlorococcus sp. MIT 1300]